MNRQLARHHAAEQLRRKREAEAERIKLLDARAEGVRRGRREAESEAARVQMPPKFMELILERMADHFARDMAAEVGKSLPGDQYMALMEVARVFAKEMRWSPVYPRDGKVILHRMMDEMGYDLIFQLSLPPMNVGYRASRDAVTLHDRIR